MNSHKASDVYRILQDAERLILEFFPAISVSALHVYFSALPFSPTISQIVKTYDRECKNTVNVQWGLHTEWSPCLQTMEGHSSSVWSVSFSPDDTKIASGSADDTVQVWDSVSGALFQTL